MKNLIYLFLVVTLLVCCEKEPTNQPCSEGGEPVDMEL